VIGALRGPQRLVRLLVHGVQCHGVLCWMEVEELRGMTDALMAGEQGVATAVGVRVHVASSWLWVRVWVRHRHGCGCGSMRQLSVVCLSADVFLTHGLHPRCTWQCHVCDRGSGALRGFALTCEAVRQKHGAGQPTTLVIGSSLVR
jgi:hypothetical protein